MTKEERYTEKLEELAENGFRFCEIDASEDSSKNGDDEDYAYFDFPAED